MDDFDHVLDGSRRNKHVKKKERKKKEKEKKGGKLAPGKEAIEYIRKEGRKRKG